VQVDEGSLFLLGRRGRSGGLKVCGAFPSVVHGSQGLVVGMRTLRAVVDCVRKGGPRFFNVIREDGEVGEFVVHG